MPLVFGGQKQHLIWRRGRHFAEKAESSAAGNFKFIKSFSDWIDRAEMTCCKLSDGFKKVGAQEGSKSHSCGLFIVRKYNYGPYTLRGINHRE